MFPFFFFFSFPKLHLQLFHPLPSKVIKETDQNPAISSSCIIKNIFYPWVEKGGKSKLLTTDHSKERVSSTYHLKEEWQSSREMKIKEKSEKEGCCFTKETNYASKQSEHKCMLVGPGL